MDSPHKRRPNIFDPAFLETAEPAGFYRRFARLGHDAGACALGLSLIELPAGRTASPYHLHHANEELLIVLAGTPSLRTPDGWRELATVPRLGQGRGARASPWAGGRWALAEPPRGCGGGLLRGGDAAGGSRSALRRRRAGSRLASGARP